MGRSSVSCFKIIACGSDSAENEDAPPPPEYKSDKRGWSFRKRSASHRVLINTVQTPSSFNKETTEIVTNNLQTQPKETFTEKTLAISSEETPQPAVVISEVSDATVASENDELNNVKPDESDIVLIQASIRGFLAKREMLKVKNVVKLQAAVRGHLVRRHAVGTLRCVQAIVKMQGLVRAHQARISSEAKHLDKETSVTKPRVEYISIEKLLSNKFAHQLLESTPRTTRINIKCDPSSRSDSAWNWLEKWMLVSSKETDLKSPSEGVESADAKSDHNQTTVIDHNSLTTDSNNVSKSNEIEISPELVSDEIENPHSVPEIESKKVSDTPEIEVSEKPEIEVSDKPEIEIEQYIKSGKRSAPEEVESEGKRFAFGTRKATNPSFIAAQLKFKESEANSVAVSSSIEKEITSEVKVDGSECGTELSVTSTLDSPDESGDSKLEIELKKEESGDSKSFEDLDNEAKAYPDMNIPNSISVQPEKLDDVNSADVEESTILVATVASELEKPKLETKEGNEKINLSMVVPDHQASAKSSAGASPKSQMTVPEFQTPPSQVSAKAKRTKSDKNSSTQKTKSSSAGKSSPSNPNQNSGSRNSLDGFPKDQKKASGKRRDSFGSGRSDYADQEPRDSSSSISLPSYMQATESAKAKALANSSPRSSPDVQEKEVYVKKRHSLPGVSVKNGSPRLQNSKSQTNQSAKANGHPHERKWQR